MEIKNHFVILLSHFFYLRTVFRCCTSTRSFILPVNILSLADSPQFSHFTTRQSKSFFFFLSYSSPSFVLYAQRAYACDVTSNLILDHFSNYGKRGRGCVSFNKLEANLFSCFIYFRFSSSILIWLIILKLI